MGFFLVEHSLGYFSVVIIDHSGLGEIAQTVGMTWR